MSNQMPIYQIKIKGRVNDQWSERLANMSISTDYSDKDSPVTTLEGPLRDQAALSGVLVSLYELHLPVLSVNCLHV